MTSLSRRQGAEGSPGRTHPGLLPAVLGSMFLLQQNWEEAVATLACLGLGAGHLDMVLHNAPCRVGSKCSMAGHPPQQSAQMLT